MTGDSITILAAHPEDEDAILPLMAAFNESDGIPWKPEPMGAALRHLLHEPSLGLVLLAREAGSDRAVGYGLATYGYDLEFAGADAFITELFVAPSFRQHGVGGKLLDSLIRCLRDAGANAVHLMVRPENERARSLYASRGFRVVPRIMMSIPLRDDAG